MKFAAHILTMILMAAPTLADAGEAAPSDPSTANVSKWEIKCVERGCVMIREVVMGSPAKPTDNDMVTFTAAFERSTQKPAFLSFEFAPDSDAAAGFQFVFTKTHPDGASFRTEADMSTQRTLPVTCDSNACTARIEQGMLPAAEGNAAMDVIDDFLHYDLFLFRFQRAGKRYQGST